MTEATTRIEVTVNGQARTAEVEPRLLLAHFLRSELRMTGTHIGCDTTSSEGAS
jgi:aerobic carbon-monoxide dehydrogenase small subunit